MEENQLVQTFKLSPSEPQCSNPTDGDQSIPMAGDLCPHCGQAILVYNGMLQVICPNCGYQAEGGAFT